MTGERADRARLAALLAERVAEACGLPVEEVECDRPVAELGLSSRDAVALAGELEELLDRTLPATLLWESPSIAELAERLTADASDAAAVVPEPATGGSPSGSSRGSSWSPAGALEPIAVVGVGCRLPGGVDGPAGFWRLLLAGEDAVGQVPAERWEPYRDGTQETAAVLERTPRDGGFLADVAGFDAEFFGISPDEAATMDPQQRLLLELAWEGLEHAGIPVASVRGSATGVFVGISSSEYSHLTGADLTRLGAWTATGGALSIAANRLSYALDLRGPSISVDTACSSSLVAVHQACTSLRAGESDLALAAGVNLLLSPAVTVSFAEAGALSAAGRCRAFDAAADGIVRGEGAAVVVLKRLADAEIDGDRILAVVRASAVNSDGRSNGLTAPNPDAQQDLLRRAYRLAGVSPAEVDYVEAHGTGTPLGDPIEAAALGAELGRDRPAERPLLIGSVKTNLGHLEAAAGIAGFVKVVLALAADRIPPSLHFSEPNPHVPFDSGRLRVAAQATAWPRYSGVAWAGVSAFGFGGTNAHVVLEEWSQHPPQLASRGRLENASGGRATSRRGLYVLCDVSVDRLRDGAAALAGWLDTEAGRAARVDDIGRTLTRRDGRGRHRAVVIARDTDELRAGLTDLAADRPSVRVIRSDTGPGGPTGGRAGGRAGRSADRGAGTGRRGAGLVWVFSGYGSQWPGMAATLLADEPAFATAVDKLDPVFVAAAGFSLSEHVAQAGELTRVEVVQPVLFGVQVALAELWRSYGVLPAAVIGHSMGEAAAAVVAGAISAEDGTRLMVHRSRLLSRLSGGAMAVVDATADEIAELGERFPGLSVAVHSSPRQTVVTGDAEVLERLVEHVVERGGFARSMGVSGAGHSPQVDPLLPELTAAVAELAGGNALVPFYSTVLDDPRQPPAFDAAYWAANVRRPVRFTEAVQAAAADGYTAFLEVSPHPTLAHPITETLGAAGLVEPLLVPTLRRGSDSDTFLTSLATLYAHGQSVARDRLHPAGRLIDLPTSPWRHVRHWVTEPGAAALSAGARTAGARPPSTSGRAPAPTAEPLQPAPPVPEPVPVPPGRTYREVVAERLLSQVAVITGHPLEHLDPAVPLTELGLDSLMAARIRAAIVRDFGLTVPPRALLAGLTLDGVVAWIVGEREATSADETRAEETSADETSADETRAEETRAEASRAEASRAEASRAEASSAEEGAAGQQPLEPPTEQLLEALTEQPVDASAAQRAARPPDASGDWPADLARPRDAAERLVAHVWEQLLGRGHVGATTDFFTIGGDTALARLVVRHLSERLGITIEPDALFGHPTVERLATLVRPALERAPSTGVRVLREGPAQAPPLFLFHAAGSPTGVYQPLAELLEAAPPCYGLERLEAAPDVESKAARYVELIQQIQPEGPYRLGGWSFGGFLAYETARRLTSAGFSVELVALIDAVRPLPTPGVSRAELARRHFAGFAEYVEKTYGYPLELPYDELTQLEDSAQIDLVLERLRAGLDLSPAIVAHQRSSYLDLRIGERYTPGPYDGRVVLYRATKPAPHTVRDPRYERTDADLGWKELCSDLRIVEVPGHHLSVLDPPSVRQIADDLSELLSPSSPGSSSLSSSRSPSGPERAGGPSDIPEPS